MTENLFLRRRIQLKRRDQLRLALLEIKSDMESQIDTDSFDPDLSRRLDAVTVLLES